MSKKSYPLRIPRYAAGIRAQETRAGAGGSWWAQRWQATLESMGLGGRLGRGRNYAVSGQVVSMAIERGGTGGASRVVAEVVGTRPEPYRVTLEFLPPGREAHARIVAALRSEPMTVARLLVDDLPMEVETIFRENGVSLFPGGKFGPGRYDVTIKCSCPDWANPCKHSAAVLLLLGEEVARRPATLLELRGISPEELYDEP